LESKNIGNGTSATPVNENLVRLADLLSDVFLLEPEEFSLELKKGEIDTWDSLGTVAMAVGIQDEFGYHFTPEEATGIESVKDIIGILTSKGIEFD
jgi:acyl carrier protein